MYLLHLTVVSVGCVEILTLRPKLPSCHIYHEVEKFLKTKKDVAKLQDKVLCSNSQTRSLTEGIFLCAEGNAIFDARFVCEPVHPATKSISVWIQIKHSKLNLSKPRRISSSEVRRWYDLAMKSLANYAEQGEVVIVFITNRTYRPKTTAYAELLKHCPRLLLLADDNSQSLSKFLGKTFGHRGLLAQQD
jgi:hypothetical protein